eukprot:IDg15227t1
MQYYTVVLRMILDQIRNQNGVDLHAVSASHRCHMIDADHQRSVCKPRPQPLSCRCPPPF